MLDDNQDAYGHALFDFLNRKEGYEIVERDDGYINLTGGPGIYFQDYGQWQEYEQHAMAYAHGKVLDIGCGAGRHSLYLQEQGYPVTGTDISPLAIQVCKARGLQDARLIPVTGLSQKLGTYDTILMMGNNFGLFSNRKRAGWLLRRFFVMTSDHGRIIAQSRDPYDTDDPLHLASHVDNRAKDRMSGQVRIRVRYKIYQTPWFDYLMVSQIEMQDILDGSGWSISDIFSGRGADYIAIIEKER